MTNDTGSAEQPIFVDRTGTRRRWFKVLGASGGVGLMVATAMVVASFLGGGPGYLPGLPGLPRPESGAHPAPAAPAHPAATEPTPSRSARSAPAGTGAPVKSGSASATPSPTQPGQGHRNTAHPTPSHKK